MYLQRKYFEHFVSSHDEGIKNIVITSTKESTSKGNNIKTYGEAVQSVIFRVQIFVLSKLMIEVSAVDSKL